ncbi:imidazole glycerol phosphate synthase subunit HisF [bacterium]|nr:imidazole glycerol phosphate synthase subunit HisF [bacterium]
MLEPRLIPCLLLQGSTLVKTRRFSSPGYVGDPINTARIFNELEVDELLLLDIGATRAGSDVQFRLLQSLCEECFMPLAYGGGISSCQQIQRLLSIGCEKVAINSALFQGGGLLQEAARQFGNQAIIASLDVKKPWFGSPGVVSHGATRKQTGGVVDWARRLEEWGAGEILLTSVDREGGWQGPDLDTIRSVTHAVSIPVIAHGGVGNLEHVAQCVHHAGASAVGVGSMVVYQAKDMGVLVQFPDREQLRRIWQRGY